MKKSIFLIIISIAGFLAGFLAIYKFLLPRSIKTEFPIFREIAPVVDKIIPEKEVIGFLPFWLMDKAKTDYSGYLNQITYFSLIIEEDGSLQKFTNPGESEPGYLALTRGKADPFLNKALEKNMHTGIAVFMLDFDNINQMLKNPETSADNLTKEVMPLMKQYGFNDLNLDVEQVEDASPEARLNFTKFVKKVSENFSQDKPGKLSIDVSASSFVKDTNLVNPREISAYVDKVIIMAYDYHYRGSYVTGPVAPGEGAGMVSEYDTKTAVEEALKVMPAKKIILGIPAYGYEWETIGDSPRSAIIPGTGLVLSNKRAEEFLSNCATCSAVFDEIDKEKHIIYKDENTGSYHQLFYPDITATEYKVKLAKEYNLGGIAIWALGYEGESIFEPLLKYSD